MDFFKWFLGLFGSKPAPEVAPPDPTDPCNSAACVNAKQRAASARAQSLKICDALQKLNSVAVVLKGFLSTPIWVLVIVLVVAGLIGGLIGGLVGTFAVLVLAVWAFAWLLALVVGKMTAALIPELLKQDLALTHALTDVLTSCPVRCQGDLTVPTCNFGQQ